MPETLTPWVHHATPRTLLTEHWMGASGAAVAGIPSGENQQLVALTLGGGFTVTEVPPGSGNFVLGLGGPGGPYVLKAGDSMTGPLILKSGSHLRVEPDASGSVAVPAEKILAVGSYSDATHFAGVYTVNEFAENHRNYLRFKVTDEFNVTAVRATIGQNAFALGVTSPLGWAANRYTFQLIGAVGAGSFGILPAGSAADDNWLCSNAYFDGSNWRKAVTASSSWLYVGSSIQGDGDNAGITVFGANSAAAGVATAAVQLFSVSKGSCVALEGTGRTAGTGVRFPNAQNASSDMNALDDYEEGTWGPWDYVGGVALPGRAGCTYVKVGRVVMLTLGYFSGSASNVGTQFSISGLPFTPILDSGGWQAGAQYGFTSLNINPSHMTQHSWTLLYGYNGVASALSCSSVFGHNLYALSCVYETST